MRALLLLGLVLLIIPAAQACQQVTPVVSLEFDGKQPCAFTYDGTYEGCETLPALGESRTYDGVVRWTWDADQCSTTGGYLQGDMVFAFSASDLSPKWMPATFEPTSISVPLVEYYGPTEMQFDAEQNRLYSEQTRPVSVTFTFERMPEGAELQQLEDRDGAARAFLKVLASGTGTGDAFGITQFIFNADELPASTDGIEPEDQKIPALPVSLLLVGIAAVALRRRI